MAHANLPFSFLFITSFIFAYLSIALAKTDPSNVQVLEVMFNTLNSPSQLTGWKIGGGDPCEVSWKGVTCLGLNGTLGYLLSDLTSLKKCDLSDNNIHDTILYQLPPNLTSFSRVRSEWSLGRWATPQLHDIDALAKMVDPTLNGMYPAKSLSRFADIIAFCFLPEPEFRPAMFEVVQALVWLVQRAGMFQRHPSDESSFGHKDHGAMDMSF